LNINIVKIGTDEYMVLLSKETSMPRSSSNHLLSIRFVSLLRHIPVFNGILRNYAICSIPI
jgi:hypothetical protein